MTMDTGMGHNSWMSLEKESSYGVRVGTSELYSRIAGGEGIKYNPSPQKRITVSGPGHIGKFPGRIRCGGPITPEISYDGMLGLLLEGAFGSLVTSGAGPDYTHTLAMANELDSYSAEVCKGDVPTGKVFEYLGGMIDQLAINFETEKQIEIIPTFLFKTRNTNVAKSGTPSFPGDYFPLFYHVSAVDLVGETSLSVKRGSLLINNNLDKDRFFMARTMSKPKRKAGGRSVTGSIVVEFEDLTILDKFDALTEGSFKFTFTSDVVIPATAVYFSLEFTGAASFLTDGEPNVSDDGAIEMTLPFQLTGGNTELAAVLVNGTASY